MSTTPRTGSLLIAPHIVIYTDNDEAASVQA
jgi:hypothetical protein